MILREIIHAHVPTLNENSTVRDAVDKMDIYQFPGLVVLAENSHVIGVVTEGDICRAVSKHGSLTSLSSDTVTAYATKFPVTVEPNVEISEALHLMLNSGLTVLPIVENEIFIGMVLRVDLMQALLMDVAGSTA